MIEMVFMIRSSSESKMTGLRPVRSTRVRPAKRLDVGSTMES
jgi:hypothetical protein